MSLLPILRWPDPHLSRAAEPVTELDDGVRRLAADMLETMYAAPGRGLAAPQVGVMRRLFVMDTAWKDGAPDPIVLLNPEIVSVSEETETRGEGCLSIPGVLAEVTRPAEVTMRWTGLDGVAHEETLTGFAAACAQHELDHLDGIVTFDRVSAEGRAELEVAYAEVQT